MLTSVLITATQGNIVQQPDCDGIVNAANTRLIAGSGVCGAIHAAAGTRLESYLKPFAPLAVGEALASPAFDLTCRFIIHVVGPQYHLDEAPAENLSKSMRSVLLLADQNGLKRLAVPAISMGIYGYPAHEAVPILVNTTFAIRSQLHSLEEIRFVLTDEKKLMLFRNSIEKI